MASLTPGVLSKLLDNVNNKSVKVAGEHRSALLQVIGIVPSLAGADDRDPWKSKGFFLRVSDSVHSAYVAVTEDDLDLILSDKIQLGQFIHVTRLDSGPSVPVLRGVRPVPKRRPCVGDPKDLISSDSLPNRSKVDFSEKGKKGVKRGELKVGKIKEKTLVRDDLKSRRLSFGNGKSEGLELRRLSLDSSRKAWDRSPRAKNGVQSVSKSKEASSSPNSATIRSARKDSSFEKDLTIKHPSLSISPLKSKNVIVSPKLASKAIIKDVKSSIDGAIASHIGKDIKSSIDGAIPSHLVKVPLSFKTWSDSKILWDSLPTTVHDVGKEVMSHRNAGFLSAVNALEETSAAEGVLRCMSKFAELCESSQKDPTVPLVDRFLNLYHSMQKAAAAVNVLIDLRSTEAKASIDYTSHSSLPEICNFFTNKTAASWVQAAIDTGLSNINLFRKEGKRDTLTSGKCHYIVLENTPTKTKDHSPENKKSPRNHGPTISNLTTKGSTLNSRPRVSNANAKKTILERTEWSEGSGLKEAATLAEKLISVSRAWFLNYLDDSIKNGFGLKGGGSGGGGLEVAALLGQLKRVNQWLDEDGSVADERIEGLKKLLYGFLLNQVNSSVVQRG